MRRLATIAVEAGRALLKHPLRSMLTAITCAVAIAVTVNVISLVYGLDEDLRQDTALLGRRTVDVARLPVLVPGMERIALGAAEVEDVRRLVADLDCVVVPRRLVAGRAEGAELVERVGVVEAPPTYLATLDVAVSAGRFLAPGDRATDVCVVDASLAASLFPGARLATVPGRTLSLSVPAGTKERRIVGVLADPLTHRAIFESFDEGRGARTLTSALLSFRNVYVPEGSFEPGAELSGLSVVAPLEAQVDDVVDRLRTRWPAVRPGTQIPMTNVGVFARRDWMDLIGASSQTGAFLSNIVWMIIVGVAVVMIATLDLLTIRERYDELAIRRVEGARRSDLAWQVTVEGLLLALAGGVAGLPLGYAGAAVLRGIVGFPFRFEAEYAVVAVGIAAVLGLFASVLPARHAAGLQPARVLSRRPR